MKQRERRHDERELVPPTGNPSAPGATVHDQVERLLEQGADAIAQALSSDSSAFLSANRQEGGQ